MHTYMCTYIIYIGTPTHTHAYYIYISVYDLFWILYIYTQIYTYLYVYIYITIHIYIYTQHQHAGTASSPWLLRRHQPGTRPSAWGFTILFHGISWLNNGEKMGYHLYSGWIMLGFNGMHQEWGIDCPMRMAVHRDDDQWWLSTASWGFKIATRDLTHEFSWTKAYVQIWVYEFIFQCVAKMLGIPFFQNWTKWMSTGSTGIPWPFDGFSPLFPVYFP